MTHEHKLSEEEEFFNVLKQRGKLSQVTLDCEERNIAKIISAREVC